MKIQEVATHTNLSIHTLRYYERLGLITPVTRAENGHRVYTEEDVNRIIFVTHLRSTGMPITQIQRYMMLAQQGSSTALERLEILEAHQAAVVRKLEELQEHLALINSKIARYREAYRKNRAPGSTDTSSLA